MDGFLKNKIRSFPSGAKGGLLAGANLLLVSGRVSINNRPNSPNLHLSRAWFFRGSRCSMVWCNYEVLQRKEFLGFLGLANLCFFCSSFKKNPKVWPPLSVDRGVIPMKVTKRLNPWVLKGLLKSCNQGKTWGKSHHPMPPRPNSAESVRGWHVPKVFQGPRCGPSQDL